MKQNQDNLVEIEAIGDEVKLTIEGEEVGSIIVPLDEQPKTFKDISVYLRDKFYPPANVKISSVKYMPPFHYKKGFCFL